MNELITEMEKAVEEYGALHDEECTLLLGKPCDCENVQIAKDIAHEWMDRTNQYWVEMCKAHRQYCSPEGRKELTRMMGKKNRITR